MAKEVEETIKDRLEKLMKMDRIQEAVAAAKIKIFPQNATQIHTSSRILNYEHEEILVIGGEKGERTVHDFEIISKEQSRKLIERGVNYGKENTSLKNLKR